MAYYRWKNGAAPDPDAVHPVPGAGSVSYVKPTLKNPNIVVGDYTYFDGVDFEAHVTHHYDFLGDRLVIGKFCQIAAGVNFVMNGANHQMNAASTYPFYIMQGWNQPAPPMSDLPFRGDTVVGNDVWIGQNATILPGAHIGDGAIIGMNSVVGGDVPPYAVVAGNPARVIRMRFDDGLIRLLLKLKWWDRRAEEIDALIPLLTCGDLEKVRAQLRSILGE